MNIKVKDGKSVVELGVYEKREAERVELLLRVIGKSVDFKPASDAAEGIRKTLEFIDGRETPAAPASGGDGKGQ